MGEEFIDWLIDLLDLVSIYLPLSFLQEEERWLSTLRKTLFYFKVRPVVFERPRDCK